MKNEVEKKNGKQADEVDILIPFRLRLYNHIRVFLLFFIVLCLYPCITLKHYEKKKGVFGSEIIFVVYYGLYTGSKRIQNTPI